MIAGIATEIGETPKTIMRSNFFFRIINEPNMDRENKKLK